MTTEIQTQIASIDPSAIAALAAADTAAREARDAELAAEAELLGAVVALVAPALRAMTIRPRTSERTYWIGTTHTDTDTERAAWAGVLLTDERAGPSKRNARANDGAYVGADLFLCPSPDGPVFRRLAYDGHWSNWQGAASSWESTEEVLSVAEVVSRYELGVLVDHLLRQIEAAQKRDLSAVAKRRLERAAQLRAVATLIGGAR